MAKAIILWSRQLFF